MNRGATLFELILALSIFMLVMTAACSTIVPGLRAFRETNARSTAQEQVLVALKKLQQDLEFSDVTTLTLFSGLDLRTTTPVSTLSFACSRPKGGPVQVDANGFPIFSVFSTYYLGRDPGSPLTGQALFLNRTNSTSTSNRRLLQFSPDPVHDVALLRNVTTFQVTAPLGTALAAKDVSGLRQNPVSIVMGASSGRYVTQSGCSATMLENAYLDPVPDDAL